MIRRTRTTRSGEEPLSDDPSYESLYEFIGYRLDRDDPVDRDPDEEEELPSLYKDIAGHLHFCFGYEWEAGSWDVHVLIICQYWRYGKTCEEIVAQFRHEFPDEEVPSILEPPPEIEDMHREVGYDA